MRTTLTGLAAVAAVMLSATPLARFAHLAIPEPATLTLLGLGLVAAARLPLRR